MNLYYELLPDDSLLKKEEKIKDDFDLFIDPFLLKELKLFYTIPEIERKINNYLKKLLIQAKKIKSKTYKFQEFKTTLINPLLKQVIIHRNKIIYVFKNGKKEYDLLPFQLPYKLKILLEQHILLIYKNNKFLNKKVYKLPIIGINIKYINGKLYVKPILKLKLNKKVGILR